MISRKVNLFLNRFVRLVEENHQTITEYFMNDLLKNNDVNAYRNIDRYVIYESSNSIYRNLSIWISQSYTRESIKEKYTALGNDRFSRGIPFHQVQKAMVLQKRHLWLYVMDNMDDDKLDYMEALELNNRVALYFDRAIFFMLKGYHDQMNKII